MRTSSLLAVAVVIGMAFAPAVALAQIMSLEEAVVQARTVNPQVRGARYRWESAKHQIIQNYTPAELRNGPLTSLVSHTWPLFVT